MKKVLCAGILVTWAMTALAVAGPPTGLNTRELLGRHLYKDKNLSFNGTQSCQVCHHPFAGFADRQNALLPESRVVSIGADGVSVGNRNAPTSAYAGYSPVLSKVNGEWVGGMFWDGRATGDVLGDPLAEQAQGPPLNPVEMAMPDKQSIIDVIEASTYAQLFLREFGPDAFADVYLAYDNVGRAVAAYERSADVTTFTSKYDLARSQFTDAENRGLVLLENNCASCHSSTEAFGAPAALFTNYQYANIGTPANPLVPLDGPDLGLGVTVGDPAQYGKFKIPTLRNIAASPPYTHNGSFPTLKRMIEFINDSSAFTPEYDGNLDARVGSMGLSPADVDDLTAFLLTLTDQ